MLATPYPGTPLYGWALGRGLIADEEDYLMRLGDCLDFTVNLTEFTD